MNRTRNYREITARAEAALERGEQLSQTDPEAYLRSRYVRLADMVGVEAATETVYLMAKLAGLDADRVTWEASEDWEEAHGRWTLRSGEPAGGEVR